MIATLIQILAWSLMISGALFFATAAVGMVRFPDIFCRLHAAAKADTTGMGLLCAGLALKSASWSTAALLLVIWLVVMASAAVNCQLLARYSVEEEHGGLPHSDDRMHLDPDSGAAWGRGHASDPGSRGVHKQEGG